jgi:cell division protein FtsB
MKPVFRILTNKFLLTAIAFLAWMTFFDQNDLMSMREKKQNLQNVKDNITYLNAEIAKMEKEHEEMTGNPQKLEQYARENFRMKRDNEDVYIIEK